MIHAWWVPAFGVKQDAIPGFVRDTWFTADKVGTYRGQCAELCGKEHGFMPIVVEVKSKDDYATWVGASRSRRSRPPRPTIPNKTVDRGASSMAQGEKVYAANCVACHQADRQGRARARSRALAGSQDRDRAQAEAQIDIVLNGKPGTAMAPFKQLSDADIAAVVTYTRNTWGNKTGDVQPAEVKAARK